MKISKDKTTAEIPGNFPRRFAYIVVDQMNIKLGDDFSASIDHAAQTVTVYKIREEFKAELAEALGQLKYTTQYVNALPAAAVVSINEYYEFINSQTGNTIAHVTLPGGLTDRETSLKLEVKKVLLANSHHISLNLIYWQNKNNRMH